MNKKILKQFCGSRVTLILQNGFSYTGVMPYEIGETFTFIDKFGGKCIIITDYVKMINEARK